MSDDLTRIKDIGPAREKWLNEHGIDTYARLAEVDPNWVCEQLKNEGKPSVLPEVVRGWREEASTIAVAPLISEPAVTLPAESQHSIPVTEEGWDEPFASFYISYQKHPTLRTRIVYRTCVDHIEANEKQQWEGIEGNKLCDWIMSHVETIVNDNRTEAAPGEAAISIPHPTKPSEIRIVSVRVHDSVGGFAAASAGEVFKGMVHGQQPLTFDFNLEYLTSDSDDTEGEGAWDCKLSLYIHEMPGGILVLKPQKISRQLLESGQTCSSVTIDTPQLPAGLYRIRAVATLSNQTPVLSVIDIPLLQII